MMAKTIVRTATAVPVRSPLEKDNGGAVQRCDPQLSYWWLMTLYRKFGIINLLREVVGGRPLPLGCGGPRARPRFRQPGF